jgi:hypothetical protein
MYHSRRRFLQLAVGRCRAGEPLWIKPCQLHRQLKHVGYEIRMQVPNELPIETEFRTGNVGCYRLIAEQL